MGDAVRIFEAFAKARPASLCDAVGDQVGTLGGKYRGDGQSRTCECCGDSTAIGWKTPCSAVEISVKEAIVELQQRRAKRNLERELDSWCSLGLGRQTQTEREKLAIATARATEAALAAKKQADADRTARREARGMPMEMRTTPPPTPTNWRPPFAPSLPEADS